MRKLKADLDRLKALLEEKNPGGAEAPSLPGSAAIRRPSCSTTRTACT